MNISSIASNTNNTNFKGAFRVIASILLAIVSFMVFETIFAAATSGIMISLYPNFSEVLNQLYELLYSNDINALNQLVVDKGTLENVITGKGLATETYVNNAIASAVTDTLGGSY